MYIFDLDEHLISISDLMFLLRKIRIICGEILKSSIIIEFLGNRQSAKPELYLLYCKKAYKTFLTSSKSNKKHTLQKTYILNMCTRRPAVYKTSIFQIEEGSSILPRAVRFEFSPAYGTVVEKVKEIPEQIVSFYLSKH